MLHLFSHDTLLAAREMVFGSQLNQSFVVELKNKNSSKNLQVLTSHCRAAAELRDRGLSECGGWAGSTEKGDWKSYGNVKQRIVILDSPMLLPRASCTGPNE